MATDIRPDRAKCIKHLNFDPQEQSAQILLKHHYLITGCTINHHVHHGGTPPVPLYSISLISIYKYCGYFLGFRFKCYPTVNFYFQTTPQTACEQWHPSLCRLHITFCFLFIFQKSLYIFFWITVYWHGLVGLMNRNEKVV